MLSNLKKSATDILSIMYPSVCSGCGNRLSLQENCICIFCLNSLPKTQFHLLPANKMEMHFWGRLKVEAAAAYCYFQKGGKIQHLIHQLKYKRKTELGSIIGNLFGQDLKTVFAFQHCDMIIPIPLHWRKQKLRGYNQCDFFADGLSESLGMVSVTSAVARNEMNESQTRKNRLQRWQNVENIFSVVDPKIIQNKNILLVDDVMTTGSTLEACGSALLKNGAHSICIATMAIAEK